MGFKLADKKYDFQIRRLLRETSMPGDIGVAYCREPNFFDSLDSTGKKNQTLIYESDNALKAMAIRSLKPVFVNGEKCDFGYLSNLRIRCDARSNIILGKGYQALKQLHQDQKVQGYLQTIIHKNNAVKDILLSQRAGLPRSKFIGRYKVYSVFLSRFKKYKINNCNIISGDSVPLKEIVKFMHRYGAERQFFPCYEDSDLKRLGFKASDFLVAIRNSEILGVIALWDQISFKQNVITGYTGMMRVGKFLFNALAPCFGYRPLPREGEEVKSVNISFICVKNNKDSVLLDLLKAAYNLISQQDYHSFLIGFHERDPLKKSVEDFFAIPYASDAYIVYWDENKEFCEQEIDNRIPYLELGML